MKISTIKRRTLPGKICSLVLAAAILALTACDARPQANPDAESLPSSSQSQVEAKGKSFANTLPIPTGASKLGVANTGHFLSAKEKYEENSDTIGWLAVPASEIDDVIVWYPGDRNKYYLRRDFNKVPNTGPLVTQYGTYFADYRCTFDGGAPGLARNTVIYGHSMEDDPDGGGFSQLKKFLDEDYAKDTPYIYFSTTDEDMAWEVFAVFYSTINLSYNKPTEPDESFMEMIGECLARSIYNYDVEITAEDKILTLSTCCYNFTAAYPNNYRYVVMARLVPPGKVLAEKASFTKNPSPKAP